MKKYLLLVATIVVLSGCGATGMENFGNEETKAEREISTSIDFTEQETASEVSSEEYYEDNFAVSVDVVQGYAKKIQQAVEEKDMDKLSDLIVYPVYIGLGENGQIIESKDDLLNLEPKEIFTDELIESVKEADESGLEPCMAGFALYNGEGTPSIIFGVQEGKLGITGINY